MSSSEAGFYYRFKAAYGTEKTLKVFSVNNKKVEVFYDENTGLAARVVSKEGSVKAISREWITGIPAKIAADPNATKQYLQNTRAELADLDEGDFHLYIKPQMLGGGNFAENFLYLLPRTTIHMFVKFAEHHSAQERARLKVLVDEGVKQWSKSGFEFKYIFPASRDDAVIEADPRLGLYGAEVRHANEETADIFMDFNASQETEVDAKEAASPMFVMQIEKRSLLGGAPSSRILADCKINNVNDIPHAIGHAVFKFLHEHQRLDRDQHVVEEKRGAEGEAQYAQRGIPFGHYDTQSVMHYPACFKRLNNKGLVTGRDKPSELDLLSARFLFNEARIKEQIARDTAKLHEDIRLGEDVLPATEIDKKKVAIEKQKAEARLQIQRTERMLRNVGNPRQLTIDAIRDQNEQLRRLSFTFGRMEGFLLDYSDSVENEISSERELLRPQGLLQQAELGVRPLSSAQANPHGTTPRPQTTPR